MAGTLTERLVTSKKLIISTIALFVSTVFIGYNFEATKPLSSIFCGLQYPVGDASAATSYGFGVADVITILFYAAVALMLTSCLEDAIEALELSKDEDFSQHVTLIVFYLSSSIFGIYALTNGNFGWGNYINGLPDHNVPFLMKAFYIYQLAFLIQCFPQTMLQGISPLECLSSLFEAQVLVLFLGITYTINYTPMAAVVVMIHYATHLIFQCVDISGGDDRTLKLYTKYALFAVEHLLTWGTALSICFGGDALGQPIRFLAVLAAAVWTALSGQALYKYSTDSDKASGSGMGPPKSIRKGRKRSKSRKGRGDRKSSRRRRR